MKTALMQAIDKLNGISFNPLFGSDMKTVDFYETMGILKSLLAAEREIIEQAYTEGMIKIIESIKHGIPDIFLEDTYAEIEKYRNGEPDEDAFDYYNQTFTDK